MRDRVLGDEWLESHRQAEPEEKQMTYYGETRDHKTGVHTTNVRMKDERKVMMRRRREWCRVDVPARDA